ncbi:hypothetical protein TorRG33x02_244700 [Trema orientale]|uniref:Uncharacterized protein n=1 Tax=Trema orientale TaxID=63057 RepID=A0A2P5DRD9_TREOI|nr:hypothetical protein TorRG33x02_244700 [Trema orientale]
MTDPPLRTTSLRLDPSCLMLALVAKSTMSSLVSATFPTPASPLTSPSPSPRAGSTPASEALHRARALNWRNDWVGSGTCGGQG